MRKFSGLPATAALAACASLAATPAAALQLPRANPVVYDAAGETVQRHRRYRDNGIDAGDVIAGVLVIGGIAALASGASRSGKRVERYPDRYPHREDPRYREPPRGYESEGLDRAVDMCVVEIERGFGQVETVEAASRDVDGWFVSGMLDSGVPFDCRIGNDGRISDIDLRDGSYVYDGSGDPAFDDVHDDGHSQYGDEVYYRARAGQRGVYGDDEPYSYGR